MEERLGKGDRWKGVIGHHRALGQLFFDILVDTMTQTWPAATENRNPVFCTSGGAGHLAICGQELADQGVGGVVSKIMSI